MNNRELRDARGQIQKFFSGKFFRGNKVGDNFWTNE